MLGQEMFEHESIEDSRSVSEFLRSLLEGMEKGRLTLAANGDQIVLNPSGLLKFAVTAEKKGTTGKISLKLSWKEDHSAPAAEEKVRITT